MWNLQDWCCQGLIRAASNKKKGKEVDFFLKKVHQKFHHPLFNPFSNVLHQNKAMHNFHKRGHCPNARCIKGLD